MISTPQYLFNRAWALTIGPNATKANPNPKGKLYASPINATIPTFNNKTAQAPIVIAGEDPTPPTGLRVVFDIDKNSVSTSNKAKFQVYNFSSQSRLHFQQGYQLQFRAGYQGLMSPIYIGDIPPGPKGSISERKGPDIITSFECEAAGKELSYSHYDFSYPPNTKVVKVVQDLVNAMGVTLGSVSGIQDDIFDDGYACTGTVKKSLDEILHDMDLDWHIDLGILKIVPRGSHSGESAVVLSSGAVSPTSFFGPYSPGYTPPQAAIAQTNTGLIGVPSQGDGFITFTALLNPQLAPGRLVQIVSQNVNGFFTLRRVHFEGDTHGQKWQATCEGVRVTATALYPQQNVGGKIKA